MEEGAAAVVSVILIILYLALAILTARSEARTTMIRNEGTEFNGFELEPRVYSNQEYMDMASVQRPGETAEALEWRFLITRNRTDYYGIILAGTFFPLYWIRWGLFRAVCTGHGRTPKQVQKDNEAQAQRINELEKELGIKHGGE